MEASKGREGSLYHEVAVLLGGLKGFVLRNFLPLSFLVALTIALAWPFPGQKVNKPEVAGVHLVTTINVCVVFFISGLTLRTDELKNAFTKKTITGTIFAFLSIILLTPLLGFGVRLLPLNPAAFSTGLAIFCVVPTTLGVGVSLVSSAKGNVALAIFLTIGTNLLGVVTIPLWIKAMLSSHSSGVESLDINFLSLFIKLVISTLVPTVLGKALCELVPGVKALVAANKTKLSLFSNSMLAILIWQTLSSGRDVIVQSTVGDMLIVIVSTLVISCIYFVVNSVIIMELRVPIREAVAAVIMSSQKSAPVAVAAITYMTSDTAIQGVLAVPCIIGQLVQIFFSHAIAQYLAGLITRHDRPAVRASSSKTLESGALADDSDKHAPASPGRCGGSPVMKRPSA